MNEISDTSFWSTICSWNTPINNSEALFVFMADWVKDQTVNTCISENADLTRSDVNLTSIAFVTTTTPRLVLVNQDQYRKSFSEFAVVVWASFNLRVMSNLPGEDLALCPTCGTQYDTPLESPPSKCTICEVGRLSHQSSLLLRVPPMLRSQSLFRKYMKLTGSGSSPIRPSFWSDLDVTAEGTR